MPRITRLNPRSTATEVAAVAAQAAIGIATPLTQNADGSMPDRRTVTADRTRILFYQLVRSDITITTASVATTNSPLPTPNDIMLAPTS